MNDSGHEHATPSLADGDGVRVIRERRSLLSAATALKLSAAIVIVAGIATLLLLPAAERPQFRNVMLSFAAATALAIVVLAYLGGTRQPTNLWLPYVSLMAVLTLVVAGAWLDRATAAIRIAAIAVLCLCFAVFAVRLVPIVVQSVAPSNAARVAAAVPSTGASSSASVS